MRCSPVGEPPLGTGRAGASTVPGRAVGVDLGARRIGVAVSDSARTVASPRTTVDRSGDRERDHRALASLVEEECATVVVVGLPLSLDGRPRQAAMAARAEAEELRALLAPGGVDVVLHDERLTTVTAHRSLAWGGRNARSRKAVVDRSAAAVLLQHWIDGHRDTW